MAVDVAADAVFELLLFLFLFGPPLLLHLEMFPRVWSTAAGTQLRRSKRKASLQFRAPTPPTEGGKGSVCSVVARRQQDAQTTASIRRKAFG